MKATADTAAVDLELFVAEHIMSQLIRRVVKEILERRDRPELSHS